MPSYADLEKEACYRAETSPPNLSKLASSLRTRYGVGPSAIGSRGDNKHLRGYHRSRRWIKESKYCTNRTYSVSRTPGDRTGGDSNWYCAIDIGGIGQAELHAMCKRLDVAVRAGLLEKITEWYGSFGDDDRVDGYDNISNRLASSDSSHLWHLHISFDRGRANEDHSDVLAVLIGEDDDTMFCKYGDKGPKVKALQLQLLALDPNCLPRFGADEGYGDETAAALSRLVSGGDAKNYGPVEWALTQQLFAAKVAGKGDKGDTGPVGPAGPPGKTPTKVRLAEVVAEVIEVTDSVPAA